MKAPEASLFSPAHPKLPRQLVLREGYGEDAFEARTPLADFFSILLEQRLLLLEPIHLTLQLLDAILQTGVLEPKQVQAIQELLLLDLCPLQRSLQPLQLKLDLLPFVNLR